jgi:2-dehydropantoate 2-reductase
MRIAIIGLGGIGSTFAFQLSRVGGHEVTAIARPGSLRLRQLQRDGGVVNAKGERAHIRVADELDEQIPYDLILLTLLAHQVDAVLPALKRSDAAAIQFMFNNFEPERLRDAIGADRCSFGMPFVQASLDADGRLSAKTDTPGQKTKMDDARWVEVFNAAGMPAMFEADMLLWLRCHVPLGAAFESVSVAAVRRNGGASWGEAMVIARGLRDSLTLIQRLGYRLYPSEASRMHALPSWIVAAVLWFVSRIRSFRDLLATGENECRALIDVMIAAAAPLDPPFTTSQIAAMKPPLL